MIKYSVKPSAKSSFWRSRELCEFGISPGHTSHDDHKLDSMLAWATRNFKGCIITISDSLYRHNYLAEGHSHTESYKKGLELGDRWLERNKAIVDSYGPFVKEMHRWDHWIEKPDFASVYGRLLEYRRQTPALYDALEQDVAGFMARKDNQGIGYDAERLAQGCRDYLLEETACYILLGREYSTARIYPAKDIHILDYLRRPDTPVELKGLERSPHVKVILNRKVSMFPEAEVA